MLGSTLLMFPAGWAQTEMDTNYGTVRGVRYADDGELKFKAKWVSINTFILNKVENSWQAAWTLPPPPEKKS